MLDLERPAPENRSDALHLVFRKGELVVDLRSEQGPVMNAQSLEGNGWTVQRAQFVGHWQAQPCFAVEIDSAVELDPMHYQVGNLYHLIGRVDDGIFNLAGRAAQLLDWERDHKFCGRCGATMKLAKGERAMTCEACSSMLYPRIAPCVITLVTRGEDMLLGRSARFRRPMFSTLAGFIEAGETAEDTLRREVREEVGVEVGDIRYYDSQAWPFPNQLMLGYFADYRSGDITPDRDEIAEADWYHPSNLPPIPPAASIAGRLILHHCRQVLGDTFSRST
jgi:NAD+ diphosphatase